MIFENINCIISLTFARDMVQIFTKVEKRDEHSGNTIAQVREFCIATELSIWHLNRLYK